MFAKRIVVIGSSSAQGKVDPDVGGYVGRLRKWREKISQHNHVYNLGISGDTTVGVLKRLKVEVSPRKPDIIVCQLGSNDASRVGSRKAPTITPEEVFQKNVKKIITQASSMSQIIFISAIPIDDEKTSPFLSSSIHFLNQDIERFAHLTKSICYDLNIPYLDIYSEFLKYDYKNLLHSDGLHPNSKGHLLIFKLLKAELLKNKWV